MANQINRDRMSILQSVVDSIGGGLANIYQDSAFGYDSIRWKVSWPSIGATDPETAQLYASTIAEAAAIAEGLNSLKLQNSWKNDYNLKVLLQAGAVKKARELRDAWAEEYAEAIREQDWYKLLALLHPNRTA